MYNAPTLASVQEHQNGRAEAKLPHSSMLDNNTQQQNTIRPFISMRIGFERESPNSSFKKFLPK